MFLVLLHLICTTSAIVDLQAFVVQGAVDQSSNDAIRGLALAYKLVEEKMTIKLASSRSSDNVKLLVSGTADFALGLEGWSDSVAASAPNLVMLPLLLTGLVPIYRLDSTSESAPLVFSREALVGIFCGTITNFQDPELVRANPLVSLPNQTIKVIIDGTPGARHSIIKTALLQFNAIMFNQTGMTISNQVDYPFSKYSSYELVRGSITSLVTSITANDGSFAL